MLDPALLEILACPACRSSVVWEPGEPGGQGWIRCLKTECGLRYPVREGIPVMLVEEAKKGAS